MTCCAPRMWLARLTLSFSTSAHRRCNSILPNEGFRWAEMDRWICVWTGKYCYCDTLNIFENLIKVNTDCLFVEKVFFPLLRRCLFIEFSHESRQTAWTSFLGSLTIQTSKPSWITVCPVVRNKNEKCRKLLKGYGLKKWTSFAHMSLWNASFSLNINNFHIKPHP